MSTELMPADTRDALRLYALEAPGPLRDATIGTGVARGRRVLSCLPVDDARDPWAALAAWHAALHWLRYDDEPVVTCLHEGGEGMRVWPVVSRVDADTTLQALHAEILAQGRAAHPWLMPDDAAWPGLDAQCRAHAVHLQGTSADAASADFMLVCEQGLWRIDCATERFGEDYQRLLSTLWTRLRVSLRDAPQTRMAEIGTLSDDVVGADERLRLQPWVAHGPHAPVQADLNRRFAAVVATERTRDAVVDEDGTLSFGELDRLSSAWAVALRDAGVARGDFVGVSFNRNHRMIVAQIAVLKLGAVFVPMDAGQPATRLAGMVEDTGLRVVLTERVHAPTLAASLPQVLAMVAEDIATDVPGAPFVAEIMSVDSPAYVIFTSGSTGRPKGVLVGHGNLLNFVDQVERWFETGDIGSQFAPFTFDASVAEIHSSLLNGGATVLLPASAIDDPGALQALMTRHGVTFAAFPPQYAKYLSPEALPTLRVLMTAGSAPDHELVRRWHGHVVYVNAYGPTETTILSTAWLADRPLDTHEAISIGAPIVNTSVKVCNRFGHALPRSAVGELLIGGAGVTLGYLHRDELTEDRFVVADGMRWYRSGDLCAFDGAGALVFAGRVDSQIKLRGHRLEPGEVEAAFVMIDGVVQAATVVVDVSGSKQLVAFCTGEPQPEEAMRARLGDLLPAWAMPNRIVWLPSLPMTVNGKTDYRRLQEQLATLDAADGDGPDLLFDDPLEAEVAAIWRNVLQQPRVGVDDHFIHLGGDSLTALVVMSMLKRLGYDATSSLLLSRPRLGDFVAALHGTGRRNVRDYAPVSGEAPLGPIQGWFFRLDLARKGVFCQSLVFDADERLDAERLQAAVARVVDHHDELRAAFALRDASRPGQASAWAQVTAEPGLALPPLTVVDMPETADAAAWDAESDRQRHALADAIALEQAPLFRMALLRDATRSRVVWALHHLVVDTISHGLLLDDLHQLYMHPEQPVEDVLPGKSIAYGAWAKALDEAVRADLPARLERWRPALVSLAQCPAPSLPGTRSTGLSIRECRLPAPETAALLERATACYRQSAEELVLAASCLALGRALGLDRVALDIEWHGRDEAFAGAQGIDRTVGWFTSVHPLAVTMPGGEGIGPWLMALKEARAAVPDRGRDFYALRYLVDTPEAQAMFADYRGPQVLFNFSGVVRRTQAGWRTAPTVAIELGEGNANPYMLSLESEIRDGELVVSLFHDEGLWAGAGDRLADGLVEALRELIAHCLVAEHARWTPSDFPLAGLDQARLDMLPAALDIAYAPTDMQRTMIRHPDTYQVFMAYRLPMHCDPEALRRAVGGWVQRHDCLRTSVRDWGDGDATMLVHSRLDVDVPVHRSDAPEAAALARIEALRGEPVRIDRAPLFQLEFHHDGGDDLVMLLSIHHLIHDGWSVDLLVNDLLAGYRHVLGQLPRRPSAPLAGVPDLLRVQRRLAADASIEAYWDSLPWNGTACAPPTLRSAPLKPDAGRDVRLHVAPLDAALTRAVREASRTMGVTANSLWLAGYAALLRFIGGLPQVRCGVIQNGRMEEIPGVETITGCCVNTLPLVLDIGDDTTGADLIGEVNRQLDRMRDMAAYPLSAIHTRMRDRIEGPLFDTLFNIESHRYADHGAGARPQLLGGYEATNHPFLFSLIERVADGASVVEPDYELRIGYDANVYDLQSVGDWVAVFAACMQALVERSAEPWRALPLLPAALHERVAHAWNATDHAFSSDCSLTDLLVAQAARTPDAVALVFDDVSLTYGELDARTNRLARHLRTLGIDREQVVGVCMQRSVEMVVALHAVVKAGAAYAPLDPELPAQRLSMMMNEVGARLVLTQRALETGALAGIEASVQLLSLDAGTDPAAAESDAPMVGLAGPRDLAYVIFTSGSTGKPKAAMNEHAPVINRIEWMQDAYRLEPGDRVLQKTPFAFDVSVWEFFWPFMVGATLVVAEPGGHRDPQYLGRVIREYSITTLHFVPSMLQVFVDAGELASCTTLKRVFASGEALPAALAAKFLAESTAELHNLYGPTEAAIDVSYFHVADRAIASVPIGRPIWNARLYILDAHGRLLPPGVAGELFIGGLVVGRGYYGRAELTAERFVESPFVAGERMYRTGDLARWRNDGQVEYLGRTDHQVKIRGFRVELGEIEGALGQHPGLDQVVVVAQGDFSSKRLVAFYTANTHRPEEGAAPTANALREFLAPTLPEYFIPSFFCRLETIPLSPNGKVDRRTLEGMDAKPVSGPAKDGARTETEQKLAAIWADLLGLASDAIDGEDDFFHLGGHSLLATRVLSRIKQAFSVDMPLKTLFERPRLINLAEAIDAAGFVDTAVIRPVQRQSRMPLSYAQERIWVLHRMDPGGVSYNVPGAVRMQGPLDIDRLEHAFRQVITRHESLRTVFLEEDGVLFQRILPEVAFDLQRFDLSETPAGSRESDAGSLCRAEATTPFDLERGPLIRARIITLADDDHLLMVNMHHIVSDGWSIGLFIEEIGHFLAGHDDELPPLPIQYADFSVWQRDWLEHGGELKRQLAYWTETLADSPELLELPTDFPRPGVLSHVGETKRFMMGGQAAHRLRQVAEGERCTLFMVLMAAVNALLYRYTGQQDICIGTPIAGRNDASTERLIGMFVNTLAIRTKLQGEMTFTELLALVKRNCLSAYDHQDAPFEKVIEVLRPKRNMAITPIFQVMVMLQNANAGATERGVRLHPIESGISKFDLSVEFEETGDGLAVAIEYSTALFRCERIARMVEHLERLCDAVATNPSMRLQDIDFLGAERQRLQTFHPGREVTHSEEGARTFMVHRWFEAQAARTPDAIAAEAGDAQVSYEALNRRANRIAHGLIAAGVGPDERVAICMERGLDMVAGMLGILKAGAAYVPLEPGYPAARLAYLLEDSAPKALLTQRALLAGDVASQAREQGVVIHAVDDDDFRHLPDHDPDVAVEPRHLAYVIYTSGSTGRPKGVMIEHAGLTHYLCWAVREYTDDGQACDSIVSSPIAFDATVTSVYLPLLTGGRAVLLQAGEEITGLETLLRSGRRWDLLKITPLHWRELGLRLAAEGVRCDVGRFVVGGEAMPYSAVEIWREVAPAARCINEYGPTETVVGCTIFDVPPGAHDFVDVPIGRPIDNTRIYILDGQRRLQPIGVPGELYIAGDGVARGYLNRPDLTAERFIDDPFVPGTRMYRSGDLARWTEEGVLEYLGRIDTQVKIRGFRIELGEIEAALCRHPRIDSAMVVTQGAPSDRRLVAFYTLAGEEGAGEETLPQEALKDFLHQSLPEYMVPTAFRSLEAIPQTPSGKLDRPALERMPVDMASTRVYIAPRNEVERELLAIWSEVLQRPAESIGMNDDFFELGGHSLLAVRIVTRAKARSGKDFPLSWLISAPTIARFAALWTSEEAAPPDDIVVPIESRGASPPIFAVPGAGGNVMSMTHLSRAIGPERAFHGLQALGLDGRTRPLESVEETAKANIRAMKSVQAQGPYHLLGHSYGGVVAYEMARQLAAAGERVGWLALLDSAVPGLVRNPPTDENDAILLGQVIAGLTGSDGESPEPTDGPIDVETAIDVLRSNGIAVDRAQIDTILAVLKANLRCYRRYRPEPMPVDLRVHLYRAIRESRRDWPEDHGWSEFLPTPPSLHAVDADHFSMLDGTHAAEIARSLPDVSRH